jgi:hypothetical protein
VNFRAKCSVPCKIIDTDDGGNIAYSTSSIIGGAFQDAFRGKLRIANWAKNEVVTPLPSQHVTEDPIISETNSVISSGQAEKIEPSEAQPTTEAKNSETQ